MNVSVKTLSKHLPEVIEALEKKEEVTLSHEGKKIALLQPVFDVEAEAKRLAADPGFGMWADWEEMKDPSAWVSEKRKRRRERLSEQFAGDRK